jgi:hypothetical protein
MFGLNDEGETMIISFYITFFLLPALFFFLYEKEPGFTISYSKKDKYSFLRATLLAKIGLFIEINIQQLGKNNLDLFSSAISFRLQRIGLRAC